MSNGAMKQRREEPTPHEQRIAAMTYRERLIFRLIRRIAHLMGKAKEFDAECDRIAMIPEAELKAQTARKIEALRSARELRAKLPADEQGQG